MLDFDRLSIRGEICEVLRNHYVALLGQQDAEVEKTIQHFINKRSPLTSMQFLAVPLPQGVVFRNVDEFEQLFLDRFINAISRSALGISLKAAVNKSILHGESSSPHSRIRATIDTLGRNMSSGYLVIFLYGLRDIAEQSLRNLLTLFRDYHSQIGVRGAEGERLRFLVAGGIDLWTFCSDRSPVLSPFNIAQCFFLNGLSTDELLDLDTNKNLRDATELYNLTGGVPCLIRVILQQETISPDLSVYFNSLQTYWRSLSSQAQDNLRNVAAGIEELPISFSNTDFSQIPMVEPYWNEAFWSGFLCMHYHQLAWRSPIHLAFVRQYTELKGDYTKTTFTQIDMRERIERLHKALLDTQYAQRRSETWQEVRSLAIQAWSDELLPVIEMLQHGEEPTLIWKHLRTILARSENLWMKNIEQNLPIKDEDPGAFLAEKIISRISALLEYSHALKMIKIFYLYAHEDEHLLGELEKHMTFMERKGLIESRHKGKIEPGKKISLEIEHYLNTSEVVVLLLSPDFLASDTVYGFAQQALQRHRTENACVIPVILRPCIQKWSGFEDIQALPRNGDPITSWPNKDEAFAEVAHEIQIIVEKFLNTH